MVIRDSKFSAITITTKKFILFSGFPAGSYTVDAVKTLSGSGARTWHNTTSKTRLLKKEIPFTINPGTITILPKSIRVVKKYGETENSTIQTYGIKTLTDAGYDELLKELKQVENPETWKIRK